MKDKIEALQACPFCGEFEAELESFDVVMDGEMGEFAGVRCQHCGINFFTDGTEEHMIRDWNTRVALLNEAEIETDAKPHYKVVDGHFGECGK